MGVITKMSDLENYDNTKEDILGAEAGYEIYNTLNIEAIKETKDDPDNEQLLAVDDKNKIIFFNYDDYTDIQNVLKYYIGDNLNYYQKIDDGVRKKMLSSY